MIQTDYSTLTIENHRMYARLRDHQFSLYEDYARKQGLQGKSLLILLWIYRHPKGISQQTITRHTYSTKQVVNAIIKNFSKKDILKAQSIRKTDEKTNHADRKRQTICRLYH